MRCSAWNGTRRAKYARGRTLRRLRHWGFAGKPFPASPACRGSRLATREPGALAGTEILVNGGKVEAVRDCGDAPGTSIEARSLFYNLPARRKFLRAEGTEAAHVENQIHLLALAHPAVRFVLIRDGRTILQLPPATRLLDRIRDLAGEAAAAELTAIESVDGAGLKISGFIGKAGVSRSTRGGQRVFINGRAVDNGIVYQALREGYHTALMKGRYPVVTLFVEMDPAAVDVNVHPAKREVRFREPGTVREALVAAVRRTLEAGRADWSRSFHQPPLPTQTQPARPARVETPVAMASVVADRAPAQLFAPPVRPPVTVPTTVADLSLFTAPPVATVAAPREQKPSPASGQFKMLGVLGRLYVLMENADGLVLVDQHAAHERILFEELRRRLEANDAISQKLLLPLTLQLPPKDADWLRRHLELLQKMGIGLEEFGAGSFKLDGLPPFLQVDEPLTLVREIIDALQSASAGASRMRLGEDMIAKTVCRHAVKANDRLRDRELVKLLDDLMACELPYCCPHGRPTMIQVS